METDDLGVAILQETRLSVGIISLETRVLKYFSLSLSLPYLSLPYLSLPYLSLPYLTLPFPPVHAFGFTSPFPAA